jgi:hypothetical protein
MLSAFAIRLYANLLQLLSNIVQTQDLFTIDTPKALCEHTVSPSGTYLPL